MSFLFRRSKRGSKNNRNRGNMNDGKQGQPFRKRSATADYPRHQHHPNIRDRTQSAKFANTSPVNKINEKPSNPIPDVIASHEDHSSTKVIDVKMANSNKVSETERKEINHTQEVKAKKHEISSSKVNNAAEKVEKRYENSTSKINHSTTQLNDNRTVVDANVQVHRPSTDVSLNNESTSSHVMNEANLINDVKSHLIDPQNRPKRKSSITYSEKEALGTLDDVLRDFDDFDANLDEVDQTESKTTQIQPINSDEFDTRYESMADIKQSLNDRDETKPNSESNYSLMPSLQQKQDKKDLVPTTELEQLYAKPIKPEKDTTASANAKKDTPKETREVAPEKSPVVPPKRFIEEDGHEIKFSPLRKASPSASLSKSLSNTTWANANEIPSPKRKPIKDKNDNFSLKRGQLSGPIPISIDDDYVEPPPDYDINATLSSIGKSTDDSFTRDTWDSMTSSSASGSRKVKKEFRPEVLKIIENKKAEKENDGRKYDGLVKRSFRMREASLSASKSSLKEETDNKSDIEKDYTTIKNEADRWLEGYERMRASSEGKKDLALKSNSAKSTEQKKEETLTVNVDNDLPAETALPQTQAVDDMQVAKDNIHTATTKSEDHQSTKVKGKTKNKPNEKSQKHLEKNGEGDSDDDDLIRLMETGVSSTEDSVDSSQPKKFGYVPRALRMSFGQSWDGIRKDRREWKSREMKHASAQASRKGGKSLSNRFDDQKEQLEMLF